MTFPRGSFLPKTALSRNNKVPVAEERWKGWGSPQWIIGLHTSNNSRGNFGCNILLIFWGLAQVTIFSWLALLQTYIRKSTKTAPGSRQEKPVSALCGSQVWNCGALWVLKGNPSSATIALINKGLKRKRFTLTETLTGTTTAFTRVGISFSTWR